MKSIEEIKNEVAVKHLFENFEQVRTCIDVGTITANTLEDILNEPCRNTPNNAVRNK
jgi:hypothetical protein